jgi:hypothetical protein
MTADLAAVMRHIFGQRAVSNEIVAAGPSTDTTRIP